MAPARRQMRHASALGQQQTHGADHGRIGQADIQVVRNALGELPRRGGPIHDAFDVEPGRAQVARKQRFEDRFLAGEVGVHPAFGQTCAQGNVFHPGARVTRLGKLLQRGVEDLPDSHGRRKTTSLPVHPCCSLFRTQAIKYRPVSR
ncbi:hypothetical protein D3C72_1678480 [compost metagenome]